MEIVGDAMKNPVMKNDEEFLKQSPMEKSLLIKVGAYICIF